MFCLIILNLLKYIFIGQEEGDQSRAGEEACSTEEGRGGQAQVNYF